MPVNLALNSLWQYGLMKTSFENFANPQQKQKLKVNWKKAPWVLLRALKIFKNIYLVIKVLFFLFCMYILYATSFKFDQKQLEKVVTENLKKQHPDNPPQNVRVILP